MVDIKISGSEQLTKLSNKLLGLVNAPTEALKFLVDSGKIEKLTQRVIKETLDAEGARKGLPRFKALSIAYGIAKKKKYPGAKILERTGASRKGALGGGGIRVTISSIDKNIAAKVVITGEAGRILGLHAVGAGRLPVRNVLGFVADDAKLLARNFRDAFTDNVKTKFR